MKFKTYKFKLKVISPIHIGNGEVYEPFRYVVKNKKLYEIDEIKYSKFISDRGKGEEFLRVCSTGNILKIRKFIYNNFSEETALFSVCVSEEYENFYKKNIENFARNQDKILNQLEIKRIQRNLVDGKAIIPGSSIKGAIRTAILDAIARVKENYQSGGNEKNDRNLQRYLLGYRDAKEDPLRNLKVSDFTLVYGKTFVDRVVNIQKFGDGRRKVPQFLEMIEPDSIFEGTISLEENFSLPLGNRRKIDIKVIKNLCKEHFYSDVYQNEYKWFGYENTNISQLKEGFILKLGMHTGAYAMTLSNYRKIKIRRNRRWVDALHQGTTWKVNSLNLPLGWVALLEEGSEEPISVEERMDAKKQIPAPKSDIEKLMKKFNRRR